MTFKVGLRNLLDELVDNLKIKIQKASKCQKKNKSRNFQMKRQSDHFHNKILYSHYIAKADMN